MKKLPDQRNLNQMNLRVRERSSNNINRDNNISFKIKEDMSKTASILEERVFGKDLKNINVQQNNKISIKNITIRQDKEKEKLNHSSNNLFNYNLLKTKEDQTAPHNQNQPINKMNKNHNRTFSLNDINEQPRNDENSPNFVNENSMKNDLIHKSVRNADLVKIGNIYFRQNQNKKEENKFNLSENIKADQMLEKCEIEVKNNPKYVIEYARDIFEYLLKTEKSNFTSYDYFRNGLQTSINEKMRGILVDWLMEVHFKFKLIPETLFLTINLLDRYLTKININSEKFQLLGVSAMLIASKYEEIYAPEIRDFVYVTDKSCSKEDILEMESKILAALDFDILTTSSLRFLERFHFISSSNSNENTNDAYKKIFYFAQYLLELSLLEYKMLEYNPSLKAASALYIARRVFKIDGPNPWTNTLEFHTNYKEKELLNCSKDMCKILQLMPTVNLKSCYKKFSSPMFMEVATLLNQKYSTK